MGAESKQQSTLTENYAAQYSSLLNQATSQLGEQQQQLAANLEIRAAVVGVDLEAQRALSNVLNGKIPHLVRIEFYSKGAAQFDEHPDAPVGHAALQMIKWAEENKKVAAEIHNKGGRQLIYSVESVLNGEGKPGGVLLLVSDLALLKQPLSGLDGRLGRATLQQKFPGIAEKTVFTVGAKAGSNEALKVKVALANGSWMLVFAPTQALFKGFGYPAETLLLAGGLWLLIALLASIAGYIVLSKKLNQNAQELYRFMGNTMHGKASVRHQFSLAMFESLSQGFAHLMRDYVANPNGDGNRTEASVSIAKNIDAAAPTEERPARTFSEIDEGYAEEFSVPDEIFRAYDIRGVYEKTLTIETTTLIGKAIGSEVIDQGERQVLVAADGRLSSPALRDALVEGLTAAGCDVIDLGTTVTPVLYFGLHHMDVKSAVMITGSHNPAEYNGLKIVIDGVTLAEDKIQELYHRIVKTEFQSGQGAVETVNINSKYMDRICNDVALISEPLKVVVDCGNGVAGAVAPLVLRALGCDVIELYCDIDGNFPNHEPDPSKAENLKDLVSRVTSEGADLGLAFDGDGDRLVVVAGSGKIIQPDRLMMLFVQDIVARNLGADVVFDVKCSKHLAEVISEAGGRPVMWKSGHSLMKAKSDELGAVLAGEFSGHLFFRERWYGFDDGIYSAARLLEVLSTEGLTLDEMMSELPWSPSTPELEIEISDDKKFAFVEQFRLNATFDGGTLTDLDGIRIDFSDGWGLVRASNTMPKLTLRFEADDELSLARIQDAFKQQLLANNSALEIPF